MSDANTLVAELYVLFRQRYAEVNRYLKFVECITENRVVGLLKLEGGDRLPVPGFEMSRELTKTFRANAYLLLYNLVEATMTNAIDTIHRAIESEGLEFINLSEKLQAVAIKHFKIAMSGDVKHIRQNLEHPIGIAVLRLGYDREKIFSGNVNCSEIQKTANNYGFISPDPNAKGRQVLRLLNEVRDKRNGLAHGRLSFEQCGHETAAEHLAKVSKETAVYLRTVLWSVSIYLRKKQYTAAPIVA
ncbi:MAE_28990/MAE_18760 family HEPN-like nuclease [Pseudomonas sp. OIL-1]|uniref:MAE_28990/MAE_18760 family HEPN-like nuclease n=1 Tax=Pseudomonas sp. OIL-1 TaxID=2706126 RepID=UPI0013A74B67|nr:MAE_28990/MAE_18760 family HEPN-like nuclease [Pseudomonas sp. OIL-1]QIB51796.1 hypothetical protein G3M63_12500 [Pseudomonas sp. OIL-1]